MEPDAKPPEDATPAPGEVASKMAALLAAEKAALEKKITETTGVAAGDPPATVTEPTKVDPDASEPGPEPEVGARTTITRDKITKRYVDGKPVLESDSTEEIVAVAMYPEGTPLAEVSYDCKMTLNLGNFESVSLTVGVKLPSVVEEIDDAFTAAKAFVDGRLNTEVAGIRKYRDSRPAS